MAESSEAPDLAPVFRDNPHDADNKAKTEWQITRAINKSQKDTERCFSSGLGFELCLNLDLNNKDDQKLFLHYFMEIRHKHKLM